jgi:adenylate kinase family enzyme
MSCALRRGLGRLWVVQRVAIVGPGGAGKTTLALELGRLTQLPVIHLDRIHWKPGWVETPSDEWEQIVAVQAQADRWIIDGNYGGTYEVRFERADAIIVLAPSRWRCLSRAVRRAASNRGRAIQAEGCIERFDLHFLRWIWRYPTVSRPELDAAIEQVRPRAAVIELRTSAEVRSFLSKFRGPASSTAAATE